MRQQRCFRKGNYPPPLDCGLGPLSRAGVFCHWPSHGAHPANSAGGVESDARRETGRIIDSTAPGAEAGKPPTCAKPKPRWDVHLPDTGKRQLGLLNRLATFLTGRFFLSHRPSKGYYNPSKIQAWVVSCGEPPR